MKSVTRRYLPLALLLAGGTVAAGLTTRKPRAAPAGPAALDPLHPPKPAPAVTFHDAAGKVVALAGYRGQGVVLNLWATWCVPCVAEMPALNRLAGALRGTRITVLAVSMDLGGAATVRRFYAAHQIDALPVLLDPDGDAAHALGARGVPTTFLIDRAGRIVALAEGGQDWASAGTIARVKALLGG